MIIEYINTVFPIGKQVEVISGQLCTATEYRPSKRFHPVSKNHSPPIEVWGYITYPIAEETP